MSVKIRLKRVGTKKLPCFRIVVMDSRSPRDGKTIDEVGFYHPTSAEDKQLHLKKEKIEEWLDKGARPTAIVKRLLNKNSITVGR